jgi:hypothetical protein
MRVAGTIVIDSKSGAVYLETEEGFWDLLAALNSAPKFAIVCGGGQESIEFREAATNVDDNHSAIRQWSDRRTLLGRS